MAQPAPQDPVAQGDAPPLDPTAIERAYRRERARRSVRIDRRTQARSSNARFWVVLAVLSFLTVALALVAWHQVQTVFGL
jgi:hypothetical protein